MKPLDRLRAFLAGVGSIIDVSGEKAYRVFRAQQRRASRSARSDWERVGDDLRRATRRS